MSIILLTDEQMRGDGHDVKTIVISSSAGLLEIENIFFSEDYFKFTFIREKDSENIDVYLSSDDESFDFHRIDAARRTFDNVVASSRMNDDDFNIDLNIFFSD